MVEVRNNGVPLMQQAPKAAITQSIGQLADALSGKIDDAAADDAGSKVRSWLNLWPARSGAVATSARPMAEHPARLLPRYDRPTNLRRLIACDRHNRLDRSCSHSARRGELSFLATPIRAIAVSYPFSECVSLELALAADSFSRNHS